eukprot:364243-Chlamydomonas_euryale.AAC.8
MRCCGTRNNTGGSHSASPARTFRTQRAAYSYAQYAGDPRARTCSPLTECSTPAGAVLSLQPALHWQDCLESQPNLQATCISRSGYSCNTATTKVAV